jgi:hypothetical protein
LFSGKEPGKVQERPSRANEAAERIRRLSAPVAGVPGEADAAAAAQHDRKPIVM